jgi:hypothetical protein
MQNQLCAGFQVTNSLFMDETVTTVSEVREILRANDGRIATMFTKKAILRSIQHINMKFDNCIFRNIHYGATGAVF